MSDLPNLLLKAQQMAAHKNHDLSLFRRPRHMTALTLSRQEPKG